MTGFFVFMALILVAAIAIPIIVVNRQKKRRSLSLELAREALGGEAQGTDGKSFTAQVGGQQLTYTVDKGPSNRDNKPFVLVTTAAPHMRFSLELRPQTREEEKYIKRGMAVDLKVGNQAFDDAFVIEAAPAAVAFRVLSPEVQADLLAVQPVAVAVGEGQVLVKRIGYVEDPDIVRRLATVATSLGGRVRSAVEEDEAAMAERAMVVEGAPFRPEVDASAARDVRAQRDAELDRLNQAKAARAQHQKMMAFVFGLIFVGLMILRVYLRAKR
jgi:hypothetical protein